MEYTNEDLNNLSKDTKRLKAELSDFIELLRERIADAAFDKNFSILKNELKAFESEVYSAGSTIARPLNPRVGQQYFDTTLNKPIFFSGSSWVDATGQEV